MSRLKLFKRILQKVTLGAVSKHGLPDDSAMELMSARIIFLSKTIVETTFDSGVLDEFEGEDEAAEEVDDLEDREEPDELQYVEDDVQDTELSGATDENTTNGVIDELGLKPTPKIKKTKSN